MIHFDSFYIDYLNKDDAKSLSEMMQFNHESFKRYFPITLSKNKSIEESLKFIVEKNIQIIDKTEFTFLIKEKVNLIVVGMIIIKKIDWNIKQGELAYCISSEFENKGLMSKSIGLISKYGFEVLGFKKFQIIVHRLNLGSLKVAQNNGFVWQKTLLNEYTPPNESPLDMELYELKFTKS